MQKNTVTGKRNVSLHIHLYSKDQNNVNIWGRKAICLALSIVLYLDTCLQ